MKFVLIDHILEEDDERIVALKQVTLAEEYLADHFPSYPLLPGVLMLEGLVQAARRLLERRTKAVMVLGNVRTLKYGAMVRPGQGLRLEVTIDKALADGAFQCRGTGTLVAPDDAISGVAVAGRFTMRPVRTDPPPHVAR